MTSAAASFVSTLPSLMSTSALSLPASVSSTTSDKSTVVFAAFTKQDVHSAALDAAKKYTTLLNAYNTQKSLVSRLQQELAAAKSEATTQKAAVASIQQALAPSSVDSNDDPITSTIQAASRLTTALTDAQQQVDQLSAQLDTAMSENKRIGDELAKVERERDTLQGRVTTTQQQYAQAVSSQHQLRTQLAEAQTVAKKAAEKNKQDTEQHATTLTTLSDKADRYVRENSELIKKNAALTDTVDRQQKQLETQQTTIDSLTQSSDALTQQNQDLHKELENQNNQIQQLSQQLQESQAQAQAVIAQAQKTHATQLKAINSDVQSLIQALGRATSEHISSTNTLATASQDIKNIADAVTALANVLGYVHFDSQHNSLADRALGIVKYAQDGISRESERLNAASTCLNSLAEPEELKLGSSNNV